MLSSLSIPRSELIGRDFNQKAIEVFRVGSMLPNIVIAVGDNTPLECDLKTVVDGELS